MANMNIRTPRFYPDIIIHLEETIPFRSPDMLDKMILHF